LSDPYSGFFKTSWAPIERIYEKGGATYQQMANEVGAPSAQAIQACLRKMGEKGLIEFKPRYRSHEKKRRV
jgi:SOS-response transcriptional repressor LexA